MYYDSEAQSIDFDGLLSSQPLGTHVYVCGPAGLIDRVTATARDWGWPDSHIHWEQFSAPPVGDAFEVFLARSKVTVHVPPDQSLLESIEARGVEVPYLCRGGVCGFCQTRVLEVDGELIHNDHFLSDADKAAITSKLEALKAKTGVQFAVATVPSLGGDEIEPYANALFRRWGIGTKGVDNGLLLILAPKRP